MIGFFWRMIAFLLAILYLVFIWPFIAVFEILGWLWQLISSVPWLVALAVLMIISIAWVRNHDVLIEQVEYGMRCVAFPIWDTSIEPIFNALRSIYNSLICIWDAFNGFTYLYFNETIVPLILACGVKDLFTELLLLLKYIIEDILINYIATLAFFDELPDWTRIIPQWIKAYDQVRILACCLCEDLCCIVEAFVWLPAPIPFLPFAGPILFWLGNENHLTAISHAINAVIALLHIIWRIFVQLITLDFPIDRPDFRVVVDELCLYGFFLTNSYEDYAQFVWDKWIPIEFVFEGTLCILNVIWCIGVFGMDIILSTIFHIDWVIPDLFGLPNPGLPYWRTTLKEKIIISANLIAPVTDPNYFIVPTAGGMILDRGTQCICNIIRRLVCDPTDPEGLCFNEGLTEDFFLVGLDFCCLTNVLLTTANDILIALYDMFLNVNGAEAWFRWLDTQPHTTILAGNLVNLFRCLFAGLQFVPKVGFCLYTIFVEIGQLAASLIDWALRFIVGLVSVPYFELALMEPSFLSTPGMAFGPAIAALRNLINETKPGSFLNCLCYTLNAGLPIPPIVLDENNVIIPCGCEPGGFVPPPTNPLDNQTKRTILEKWNDAMTFGDDYWGYRWQRASAGRLTPMMRYKNDTWSPYILKDRIVSNMELYGAPKALQNDFDAYIDKKGAEMMDKWEATRTCQTTRRQALSNPHNYMSKMRENNFAAPTCSSGFTRIGYVNKPFRPDHLKFDHKNRIETRPPEPTIMGCPGPAEPKLACFDLCCIFRATLKLAIRLIILILNMLQGFIDGELENPKWQYFSGTNCPDCFEEEFIELIVLIVDVPVCICRLVNLIFPASAFNPRPDLCCALTLTADLIACILTVFVHSVRSLALEAPHFTYFNGGFFQSDVDVLFDITLGVGDCFCDFVNYVLPTGGDFDFCCVVRVSLKIVIELLRWILQIIINLATIDGVGAAYFRGSNIDFIPFVLQGDVVWQAAFGAPGGTCSAQGFDQGQGGLTSCMCQVLSWIIPIRQIPGEPITDANCPIIDLCCPIRESMFAIFFALQFGTRLLASVWQEWEDGLPQRFFDFVFCNEGRQCRPGDGPFCVPEPGDPGCGKIQPIFESIIDIIIDCPCQFFSLVDMWLAQAFGEFGCFCQPNVGVLYNIGVLAEELLRTVITLIRRVNDPTYWSAPPANPEEGFGLFDTWIFRFIGPVINALCNLIGGSMCFIDSVLGLPCQYMRRRVIQSFVRWTLEFIVRIGAFVEGFVRVFAQNIESSIDPNDLPDIQAPPQYNIELADLAQVMADLFSFPLDMLIGDASVTCKVVNPGPAEGACPYTTSMGMLTGGDPCCCYAGTWIEDSGKCKQCINPVYEPCDIMESRRLIDDYLTCFGGNPGQTNQCDAQAPYLDVGAYLQCLSTPILGGMACELNANTSTVQDFVDCIGQDSGGMMSPCNSLVPNNTIAAMNYFNCVAPQGNNPCDIIAPAEVDYCLMTNEPPEECVDRVLVSCDPFAPTRNPLDGVIIAFLRYFRCMIQAIFTGGNDMGQTTPAVLFDALITLISIIWQISDAFIRLIASIIIFFLFIFVALQGGCECINGGLAVQRGGLCYPCEESMANGCQIASQFGETATNVTVIDNVCFDQGSNMVVSSTFDIGPCSPGGASPFPLCSFTQVIEAFLAVFESFLDLFTTGFVLPTPPPTAKRRREQTRAHFTEKAKRSPRNIYHVSNIIDGLAQAMWGFDTVDCMDDIRSCLCRNFHLPVCTFDIRTQTFDPPTLTEEDVLNAMANHVEGASLCARDICDCAGMPWSSVSHADKSRYVECIDRLIQGERLHELSPLIPKDVFMIRDGIYKTYQNTHEKLAEDLRQNKDHLFNMPTTPRKRRMIEKERVVNQRIKERRDKLLKMASQDKRWKDSMTLDAFLKLDAYEYKLRTGYYAHLMRHAYNNFKRGSWKAPFWPVVVSIKNNVVNLSRTVRNLPLRKFFSTSYEAVSVTERYTRRAINIGPMNALKNIREKWRNLPKNVAARKRAAEKRKQFQHIMEASPLYKWWYAKSDGEWVNPFAPFIQHMKNTIAWNRENYAEATNLFNADLHMKQRYNKWTQRWAVKWTPEKEHNWEAVKRVYYRIYYAFSNEKPTRDIHERFILNCHCALADGFVDQAVFLLSYCVNDFMPNLPPFERKRMEKENVVFQKLANFAKRDTFASNPRVYLPEDEIKQRDEDAKHFTTWFDWFFTRNRNWIRRRVEPAPDRAREIRRKIMENMTRQQWLRSIGDQPFHLINWFTCLIDMLFGTTFDATLAIWLMEIEAWFLNDNLDWFAGPVGFQYWVNFFIDCKFFLNLNCSVGWGLERSIGFVTLWSIVVFGLASIVMPSILLIPISVGGLIFYIILIPAMAWHYSPRCWLMTPALIIPGQGAVGVNITPWPFPVAFPALPFCLMDDIHAFISKYVTNCYNFLWGGPLEFLFAPYMLVGPVCPPCPQKVNHVNCQNVGLSDGLQNVIYGLNRWVPGFANFIHVLYMFPAFNGTLLSFFPFDLSYLINQIAEFTNVSPVQALRLNWCFWATLIAVSYVLFFGFFIFTGAAVLVRLLQYLGSAIGTRRKMNLLMRPLTVSLSNGALNAMTLMMKNLLNSANGELANAETAANASKTMTILECLEQLPRAWDTKWGLWLRN
jgi:hypothetical protein